VRQILLNLISNAIKFTERGEVIVTVSAEPIEARRFLLVFSIRDTGIGIKLEEQARLFAPFTQADVSTTRRFGGTGLGLSIVQRLTDLMGGEVGVNSEPGHGSEFWVKLPLVIPMMPSTDAASAVSLPLMSADSRRERLTGFRVLIVDDNPVNLEVMGSVLKRSGAVTFTRSNGLEAVDFLRRNEVDMVLMDVQMPVMDGCEATRKIRKELGLATLPILAVTAGAMITERQSALEAGMNEFLTKPLPPARLINILRSYAERGSANTDY
jgi:CheY-like chemotaxis protein